MNAADLSAMTLGELLAELERVDAEIAVPPVAGTAMQTVWRQLYDLALHACHIQVEITRRYAAQAAEACSARAVGTAGCGRWQPPGAGGGAMDEAHAEVRRIGRWTYLVSIHDGCMVYGPGGHGWHVWGQRRAERKARRVLAAYGRDEQRRTNPTIVRAVVGEADRG